MSRTHAFPLGSLSWHRRCPGHRLEVLLLTISRDSFKAHQIASLTTRRCTNADFLILLVSISSSYSLKGLGCNPLNPLLPQSSRQSNRSTGSNPRRVWVSALSFSSFWSSPSSKSGSSYRSNEKTDRQNVQSPKTLGNLIQKKSKEWEAPHHEPTEAFDVFQNVFFNLQERHWKYMKISSNLQPRRRQTFWSDDLRVLQNLSENLSDLSAESTSRTWLNDIEISYIIYYIIII